MTSSAEAKTSSGVGSRTRAARMRAVAIRSSLAPDSASLLFAPAPPSALGAAAVFEESAASRAVPGAADVGGRRRTR